jgi:hypothetical protein
MLLAIDADIRFAVFDEVSDKNNSHSPTSASARSSTLAPLPWITLASITCSRSVRQPFVLLDHGNRVVFLREDGSEVTPDFSRADDDDVHGTFIPTHSPGGRMLATSTRKSNAQGGGGEVPFYLLRPG